MSARPVVAVVEDDAALREELALLLERAGYQVHACGSAAELAALGFTGPTQIYEFHDGGVLKAFSDASDPAPLTRPPLTDWLAGERSHGPGLALAGAITRLLRDHRTVP